MSSYITHAYLLVHARKDAVTLKMRTRRIKEDDNQIEVKDRWQECSAVLLHYN